MPAKKEIKVNLLPQKEFEKSTLGRLLKWALSTFRIIVIVTEMVVMAAFLSRFWLDAKNSDLNNSINQKKAVILSFKETEGAFKNFQNQIDIFSKITSLPAQSEYVKKIVSFLPEGVSLNSIAENENSVQIVGISKSEGSVLQFIKNLTSIKEFKEVTLNKVDSGVDDPTMIIFTVKLAISQT